MSRNARHQLHLQQSVVAHARELPFRTSTAAAVRAPTLRSMMKGCLRPPWCITSRITYRRYSLTCSARGRGGDGWVCRCVFGVLTRLSIVTGCCTSQTEGRSRSHAPQTALPPAVAAKQTWWPSKHHRSAAGTWVLYNAAGSAPSN